MKAASRIEKETADYWGFSLETTYDLARRSFSNGEDYVHVKVGDEIKRFPGIFFEKADPQVATAGGR